ncbi:MAG TPA: tetratricopeptide repeat protein [Pyrinomonadaceae bacterium]|nr:tetratricopeptide repeat protein [Pyrinomonadaceae bacterium]
MALPTAEARQNLLKLAEKQPENPQILERLADLEEKLLLFEEAEKNLKRLAGIDAAKLVNLAVFYHSRARFEDEAAILRKILFSTEAENRAQVFERLINLARIHDLREYLKPEFFAEVARENPNVYEIFQRLIEKLIEEKNYSEALNFTQQAKAQFPEMQGVLLEKEVDILLEMGEPQEAEKVYRAAFDPFWSAEEAGKFYDFLNRQDRLRAYGAELKTRFKQNPADFDAAIRLALYRDHDYSYGNDDLSPIILKLEQAKKDWTIEELVTVTRLLLQANEGDLASRFLYTLYLREDFQKSGEMRAKILYQLFEMFSDAENQRLPLTKGDLRFYEDVAKADTKPGIATGILSLIFSDTNPRQRLEEQEVKATKYFNRAAAYRIFEEYKKEFPTSPELAQMYLDIVRLYTATGETEIAEKTLNEFAERYENSSDYPAVALKLADAFVFVGNAEKERKIYRKVLDSLGKNQKGAQNSDNNYSNYFTAQSFEFSPNRNEGINIPSEKSKNDYYYSEPETNFRDYLGRKTPAITYEEVLEKLVASFAKEKKTAEILAVYSDEIAKYPEEEWLYERRLAWLEQTNLTGEQLEVYQKALARFQSRGWQDKLARFFLRQNRQAEFAGLSGDLIGKLNDREIESYLSQFVDGKISASGFEKHLYLKLYQTAHARFPHNPSFVGGLLRFYKTNKQEDEWRKLAAAYYFESKIVREQFLDRLAEKGELRNYLEQAKNKEGIVYELFRADASARLSNFENAVAAYRKLNQIYPNETEFSERLIAFTRSFGQKNAELLTEAANVSKARADFLSASATYRTRSGEIFAELGNYENAREEWEKLIPTAKGEKEIYLDTATVFWDYFQYEDARRTIEKLREKFWDETLYAFEAGAILEAQRRQNEAIGEYVKALGSGGDETQKERAKRRLAVLFARERREKGNQLGRFIEAAFFKERAWRKNPSLLSLGYAEFLAQIKETEKAENLLNQAIRQSSDSEFLEAARYFYQREGISTGEQAALKRLAEASASPRQSIAFYLQLAESFSENNKRDSAKAVLNQLVRKFPTNYGVITETADFYYRLGFETEAVKTLQSALPKSRGWYRTALAQKLGKRLIQLNRLDSAERILTELHDEEKSNAEIFAELAKVYVRQNKPESLRKSFAETVAALERTEADRRELDWEIAELRGQMIDAFTRLGDFRSAVEQHIEIINREPENEELTENAVAYVQRYGGSETLLNYYLKTSREAFKNYRWNVVLARIYEANKDLENAAKNYQTAIVNQPEMHELYLSLAEIEEKRNNFDEALKNLDEVLVMTNDAPEFVKKKIEILKKAGRIEEIEAEKAKLPAEKKITVDQFAEARKLANTEKAKSRELYREAFARLFENPLSGEMTAADISGYVRSAREEEPLDQINERLWLLREKLLAIADEANSTQAGEARKRRAILDGAMVEAVAAIAKTVGTDEEISALHQDWQSRIEKISFSNDAHNNVALIQDLSRRAGFGDLEEKILLRRLEETRFAEDRQTFLHNLVDFYNQRGAYQKTFELLEEIGSGDLILKAETARLVGNRDKELDALRAIYWRPNEKITNSIDASVARYLEILYTENREELKSLSGKSSVYQLQLINFLLGKGERELTHSAIESAALPQAWKLSRHAETSLALKEFDETAECYFCHALQLDSIGNLIAQIPDKKRFLINDDWFRLTRQYGEWIEEKLKLRNNTDEHRFSEGKKYLTAMIENQPRNSDEQTKFGAFYLEKGELKSAVEHLRLAVEMNAEDRAAWAELGAAYFKIGRKDYAEQSWEKALQAEDVQSGLIYFQGLRKYDLSGEAREKLKPVIVKFLENFDAEDSGDFQNLIRAVAASFVDEAEKSAYFLHILERRPTDTSLAEMLTGENLVAKSEQGKFYELLIERGEGLSSYTYDYNFKSVQQRAWTIADAESIYEQDNEFKAEEPENKRLNWQRNYLELLLAEGENARAEKLIAEIEKELNGRYARPDWLRLAKIRLRIRSGKFDFAEAERFIGVSVSESAAKIIPPDSERFNEVLRILKDEKLDAQAIQLSESFFARMLALERFDAANFIGLARAQFQKGETEKALRVLQLMIDASEEEKRETALAELTALDIIKAKMADATKLSENETKVISVQSEMLKLAAEIAFEFGQTEAAITFHSELLIVAPNDAENKIRLAEILIQNNQKDKAVLILNEILNDRNSLRPARWDARRILFGAGANVEIPIIAFDSFSQFYNGFSVEKSNQNEAVEFFINSLIADKDAETSARQKLIELYALSGKPFAALKLAETDRTAKSDELLEILSEAAEKIGDYAKAIEFEKMKSAENAERVAHLQRLANEKNWKATDFTVDLENTRKL